MSYDISVVIVNWNVREYLKAAIQSVNKTKGTLSIETIVIDNASGDGSADMVRQEFPDVALIANEDNRGFPAGCNQGMSIAKGKYIFLLNPDTIVQENAMQQMYAYMEQHPETGLVAPKLLNTDLTLQPSCRRFPKVRYQILDRLLLSSLFPSTILNGGRMGEFSYNEVAQVDQPMGAALFARKDIVEHVGLMDEHNFVWFDEVDWCYQIKKAGYRIVFLPQAEIVHHQGKSFRLWKNPFSGIVWLKSRHHFLRKNYGVYRAFNFLFIDIFFYLGYGLLLLYSMFLILSVF